MRRFLLACVLLVGAFRSEAHAQPIDPTDLDFDGMPGVAGPPPPGSEAPEVFALQGTGSILIDRGHLETFNVNGFMWFLISQGWTVATNEEYPITATILAPYDVVIIPVGTSLIVPFSADEVAAFTSYLADGHGLWLFHESLHNPNGINSLATSFGVTFHNDSVVDSTDNEGAIFWPRISNLGNHPITQDVTSFGYYGGCCLTVTLPAAVIASADGDASSADCPTAPAVLAAYEAAGRVVFCGDNTPLHPTYYPGLLRDEEELLLQNIINWLAGLPPSATQPTTWGGIKGLYR